MQYAAHLPNTRVLVAPVVALAIGAAGATGIYALVDDDAGTTPAAIVISEPVTTGPNEAGVAAAVSSAPVVSLSSGPNEAGVAAAVSSAPVVSQSSGKNEASTAAAVGSPAQQLGGPDESATASFIGGAH